MHKSDLRWFYILGYPPGVSGFSDRGFIHLGRFCMYRGELPRSYTRLKHTLTADSPQPRPRPARPPAYDPEFEAAFDACNEAYQQAAAQWNRQNTAYMAYIGEMMISMSTGTPPPARVTVAGDMPIMPSRAAFGATYYGSTPEGTGCSGNQASQGGCEVTPVHEGGRSAGASPSTTPGTTPGASPSTSPGRTSGPSPGGSFAASTGAQPRAARFANDVGGHTPPGSFLR
nr:dirigent protein 25-like [Lolium perenne]XP_051187558.1 dirigent protein 25-like [Lolium perenne]